MAKILLVNPCDRDEPVHVYVIGQDSAGKPVKESVGYADYDQHGSLGMEAVYQMARDMASALVKAGVAVEFDEVDSDPAEDEEEHF